MDLRHLRHLLLTLLLPLATEIPAQTPTEPTVPTPTYDVVSIAPHKADANSSGWETHDATFTATNINLKMLVSFACNIRQDLISGLPGWADSARFDINAKIVDPDLPTLKKLTRQQHNAMLVQMLTDRFQLKTHTETRQLPVYNLVRTPHGPKFKPSPTQDPTKGSWFDNNAEFTGIVMPMAGLVDFLAGELHRTVIDQTSLTALYELHLKWAPDRPAAAAGQDTGQTDDTGPSLFSALVDQLGLKLVPAKAPVTTLVVDHLDPPTPN